MAAAAQGYSLNTVSEQKNESGQTTLTNGGHNNSNIHLPNIPIQQQSQTSRQRKLGNSMLHLTNSS